MNRSIAPYLRKWTRDERERTESAFSPMPTVKTKRAISNRMFCTWLTIVVGIVLAMAIVSHHSAAASRYHAHAGTDERLLSSTSDADREAQFDRVVMRELAGL
jgi:hypothetical protein